MSKPKKKVSPWTQFMDMHSGGRTKHKYEYIYIEAPEAEARVVFYNRFESSPDRVTCTCCGEDYSVSESESLEQATAYNRGCAFVYLRPDGTECDQTEGFVSGNGIKKGYTSRYVERNDTGKFAYKKYIPMATFLKDGGFKEGKYLKKVLIIRAADILPHERIGEVPEQGYVWQD